jgi:hypothetical protein
VVVFDKARHIVGEGIFTTDAHRPAATRDARGPNRDAVRVEVIVFLPGPPPFT